MERLRNVSFLLLVAVFIWSRPMTLGATYDCESIPYGYGYPLVHDSGTCADADAACAEACWECYGAEDPEPFGCQEEQYSGGGTWFWSFCDCFLFPNP